LHVIGQEVFAPGVVHVQDLLVGAQGDTVRARDVLTVSNTSVIRAERDAR
jgi:hypothetical protein